MLFISYSKMRFKSVLNKDLLAIVGDFAGSEHFFLTFTLTPKLGFLSKILITSRSLILNRIYYGKLNISHWKRITRASTIPSGKRLLAIGVDLWGVDEDCVKYLSDVQDFVLTIY